MMHCSHVPSDREEGQLSKTEQSIVHAGMRHSERITCAVRKRSGVITRRQYYAVRVTSVSYRLVS